MEETRRRGRADHVRHRVRGRDGVPEPGWLAGAGLRGRLRAVIARRRGDGTRAAHENDPGGEQGSGRAAGRGARQGDLHGQGGKRVAVGRQFQFGPKRDGGYRECAAAMYFFSDVSH